jgi:hypothetical protein
VSVALPYNLSASESVRKVSAGAGAGTGAGTVIGLPLSGQLLPLAGGVGFGP